MTQLVFLHGPGGGACAEAYRYQLRHFRGSLAPELPGHLGGGTSCPSVERYVEWVRGWLWAQGHRRDLVLVGYTLGAAIALQYGLDYPDEVKGLILMTVAMRPKKLAQDRLDFRLRAAKDPVEHEKWLQGMHELMHFVDPELREDLMGFHRKIGPLSQYNDLVVMEQFDIRDRISTLRPKLFLIRGLDCHLSSGDFEGEIHRAVPASTYMSLHQAGHFPMAEQPAVINKAIEEFLATLP